MHSHLFTNLVELSELLATLGVFYHSWFLEKMKTGT
jgi:hypothetical protein